jgi:L-histidine N-alpha-methyltransferase
VSEEDPDVAAAALAGLRATPKTLPPKLFYDDEGCRLFEAITRLPEYYVTRTERALLSDTAPAIGARVPQRASVVEYGASSPDKAAILLAALTRPAAYVPIDVAPAAVAETGRHIAAWFPRLSVHPIAADFTAAITLPREIDGLKRVGFFPGSTIGNFEPSAAIAFLRRVRTTLGADAFLCVGVDLAKDPAILVPAYDDAAGVTAAFNLNLLRRLNREAAADFDLEGFAHRAVWNAAESRIEMHLVSRRAQTVRIAGETIAFAAGETIHTENSYKHAESSFTRLATAGGWSSIAMWMDPEALFSVHLLVANPG